MTMSWESISLSDALRPLKSSPFTRDELNYSGGQYQNVHYGDILVRFPSVVDAEKEGLPYVSDSAEGRCSRCSLLQNGDIIIADTAEDEAVGKAIEIQGITDQKVVSGLHTMAFRPQEGLFAPGFLGYFLNSSVYHNQLLPLMQGIKVLSISKTAIGDTAIKYPSYKEQEKIVESLSGVDDMIGALDEAIAKKQQIKEGLMQQLLTGETRLPGFSGEWKREPLSKHASVLRGGSPRPIEAYLTNDPDGINWIKIGDVGIGAKYIVKTEERIIPDGVSHSRAVKAGDFLLSNSMSFGRPYILKIDGCIHDGWLVIQEYYDSFDTDYLYYALNAPETIEQYKSMAAGSSVLNLNKDIVKRVMLNIPEIDEQRAIASVLSSADNEIVELESKRNKYDLIKQGMMQDLLTGKTRLI